jgi:putative oxidoreductase
MQYGQWIGRTALALIFLFNALGIVDQTRPAHELAAHGAPAALVPTLIMAGRALQLVAGIALVIGWHERIAALLLALFLIPATLTAHDFWASPGPEFQGQLVNFLKNLGMFGGLCFVAFSLPTSAAGARRTSPSEEGSMMRAARDHSTSGAPGGSVST